MTIVEKLKGLIKSEGGNPSGISTISQAVGVMQAIEDSKNPLSALAVDSSIGGSVDLLYKVVGDLQKDVVVGANNITGTLYYVDDYTGFSGDPDEQSGWYLVVHAEVPDVDGVTIKYKHSQKSGEVTLDSDGILIQRLTPEYVNNDIRMTFIASKSGYVDYSKTFTVSGIVLGEAKDD